MQLIAKIILISQDKITLSVTPPTIDNWYK